MTEKELLYMEDAIGHEQILAVICQNFSGALEDKELCDFLTKIAKKHQNLKDKLMKVLESVK